MANRKLIRPEVTEGGRGGSRGVRRKQTPPEQTHAEEFYYLKQMASKTPMVVTLKDGEEVKGWIEWYDKSALKIHRSDGPNLLLPKSNIKYMFKEEELKKKRGRSGS